MLGKTMVKIYYVDNFRLGFYILQFAYSLLAMQNYLGFRGSMCHLATVLGIFAALLPNSSLPSHTAVLICCLSNVSISICWLIDYWIFLPSFSKLCWLRWVPVWPLGMMDGWWWWWKWKWWKENESSTFTKVPKGSLFSVASASDVLSSISCLDDSF